jgi:hypothetical protein
MGLKAGVITAAIIAFIWGIGFFVGLTHIDPRANVDYLIATGQKSKIVESLSYLTRQNMFERAKFWSMPNFLTGFLIAIAATAILSRKRRAAQ